MRDHDQLRLHRLRARLRELATADVELVVFGAGRHAWHSEDTIAADELDAFEAAHAIELPGELRAWLELVGPGAGPYYGLMGLPAPDEAAALQLAAPFVGDLDDASVATDPRRRGGYLPLADQGCGYASVLVLAGPRRGVVLADMREAHEGFLPEAPSLFAWLDDWLDRALAEWALRSLPELLRRDEPLSLAATLGPLLERRAAPDWQDPSGLYPTAEVERVEALLLFLVHQRRLDAAEALLERLHAVEHRDADARRELARARIAGARGDAETRLAAADRGLALCTWHDSETQLLREREDALLELGRRGDAIDTILRRAAHTRHLHAYFDAAWLLVEDGEHERAATVLQQACEATGDDDVESCAEGLLAALRDDGRDAAAQRLLAAIRALA
jgi:hypothetical protein